MLEVARAGAEEVMRGEWHLTKPQQYALVYEKGSSGASGILVMKTLQNGLAFSRYGFSVSKRIGKAVVRNRVKRLLREILRTTALKPGWDIVFIARSPAAATSYEDLKRAVDQLISRAHLMCKVVDGDGELIGQTEGQK